MAQVLSIDPNSPKNSLPSLVIILTILPATFAVIVYNSGFYDVFTSIN